MGKCLQPHLASRVRLDFERPSPRSHSSHDRCFSLLTIFEGCCSEGGVRKTNHDRKASWRGGILDEVERDPAFAREVYVIDIRVGSLGALSKGTTCRRLRTSSESCRSRVKPVQVHGLPHDGGCSKRASGLVWYVGAIGAYRCALFPTALHLPEHPSALHLLIICYCAPGTIWRCCVLSRPLFFYHLSAVHRDLPSSQRVVPAKASSMTTRLW